MSDQVWISPYNINTVSSNENKEKYQLGDELLIQYQILKTNIIRIVWQIERRLLIRSCYKMAKNSTKKKGAKFLSLTNNLGERVTPFENVRFTLTSAPYIAN